MDTLESLRRKIGSAGELESVVKTMKAMAAGNISQYEMATTSLNDYYQNVELGMIAYLMQKKEKVVKEEIVSKEAKSICAIVFGSDQGLVGQFNNLVADFTIQSLQKLDGKKEIWSVGERVQERLSDSEYKVTKLFSVPNSVSAITSLVGQLLISIEEAKEKDKINEFYIFYNRPKIGAGYEPGSQRLLPLDSNWKHDLDKRKWPTKKLPQVIGRLDSTLAALIREYLFVSIYKASAESLASENASRLEAMQRAEKNINELLDEMNNKYHRLRQSSIDEELFDVVSGFEALRKNN
ncbi:MAG: F0F1 ATP synthase subunit gamma [Bacteroidia bacterium]